MTSHLPRFPWLLFILALALRILWITGPWNPRGAAPEFDDERLHWQLATNLVQHGKLVTDDGRRAARMPGYPLLLAPWAALGQKGMLGARLVQAVIGAATTLVACGLAGTALGRRGAVAAGVLTACDPYAIFSCHLLLSEVPFMLLGVGFTSCVWTVATQPAEKARRARIGVALLGPAAVLMRPSATGWVFLTWLLLAWFERDRRRALMQLLANATALVMVLLPWGLRNRAVMGSFAWLSANGGVTLYDAQGPQADGSSNQAFLHEMPELVGLDEGQRDQLLGRLALAQMRADPARALRLAGTKFLRTWNFIPNVPAHRGGSTAVLSAAYTALALLLAGLALRKKMPPMYVTLLAMPVIYFTLLHCVYIGSLRYRIPLMPFVELLGAATFVTARMGRTTALPPESAASGDRARRS